MKFYSEFGEDRWLYENNHLGGKSHVYVDLGAADPWTASNTALLRDLGWRGLAIDGNPIHAHKWKTPFVNAIISDEPEVPFNFHPNHVVSRVEAGNPIVPAVTLESLLQRYDIGLIDLLSVDIEGHEFNAIKTMDLAIHRPRMIIGEYNTEGLGEDFRLRDYLLENHYKVVHQTFANLIYFLK